MDRALVRETRTVGIETILAHPDNARRGSTAVLEQSLRAHGQYAPLIVQQATGYIIKGNNTYRVMREKLGLREALVTYVACSDEQARAILAIDNRASDSSTYDPKALAALLAQIDQDDMLPASGYEAEDLAKLLDDMAGPDEEPGLPNCLHGINVAAFCQRCHDTATAQHPEWSPPEEVTPQPASPPKNPEVAVEQTGGLSVPTEYTLTLRYTDARGRWVLRKLSALGIEWDAKDHEQMLVELIQEAAGEAAPA